MLVSSRRAQRLEPGRISLSLSLSLSLSSLAKFSLFVKTKPINLRVDLSLDHVGRFLNGANLLGPFFVERDFNCSSNAIMISTVSKESAPKSTNLESAATASRSVPSCSEMMPLTLSRVSPDCASWSGKDKQEMCACGQSNVFTLFYGTS